MLALAALKLMLVKYRIVSEFDRVVGLIESSGAWESVTRLRSSADDKIRMLALSLDVEAMRVK
eukprot:gene2146-2796_t